VLSEPGQFRACLRTAIGRNGICQGTIQREQIDVLEGRRLVKDLVGRQ
jgi:hypothetical protein